MPTDYDHGQLVIPSTRLPLRFIPFECVHCIGFSSTPTKFGDLVPGGKLGFPLILHFLFAQWSQDEEKERKNRVKKMKRPSVLDEADIMVLLYR